MLRRITAILVLLLALVFTAGGVADAQTFKLPRGLKLSLPPALSKIDKEIIATIAEWISALHCVTSEQEHLCLLSEGYLSAGLRL